MSKRRVIQISVNNHLQDIWKETSKKLNMSMSEFIRHCVFEFIKNNA